MTTKQLAEMIGEGIHTYLRKLCESRASNRVWFAIKEMPDEEWSRVCLAIAEDIQEQLNKELAQSGVK